MTIIELQELYYDKFLLLKDFCDKNGLTVFPVGGTLLGIVLNNNFIPWDDDLDLAMPRKDYDTLYRLRNRLQDMGLIVERYKCSRYFPYPYIKIIFKDCILTDIEDETYNFDSSLVPAIDLYPIDMVGNTKREIAAKMRCVNFVKQIYDVKVTPLFKINNPIKRVAAMVVHWIPLRWILACYDRCMSAKAGGEFVTRWRGPDYEKHVYNNSAWNDTEKFLFRTTLVDCPAGYDEILKDVYGDYTKPYTFQGKMRHASDKNDVTYQYFKYLKERFK